MQPQRPRSLSMTTATAGKPLRRPLQPHVILRNVPIADQQQGSCFASSLDQKRQAEYRWQCRVFRDIFGNPFRPVSLNAEWLTSTVVALAEGIYAERAFDRMPILADALQDAGCDNDDVLNHCRDTSLTHVRGCWVVDLVLAKKRCRQKKTAILRGRRGRKLSGGGRTTNKKTKNNQGGAPQEGRRKTNWASVPCAPSRPGFPPRRATPSSPPARPRAPVRWGSFLTPQS